MMAFLTKMIMMMTMIIMILMMMVFPMMKTMMMTMMVFLTKRILMMTMMAFLTKNMKRMILKRALLVLLGFPLPFLPLSLGASLEMSCDKKEQMNLLQYHFTYHYLSFIFQIFNR